MALLIAVGQDGWLTDEEIRDDLLRLTPGADIRTPGAMGDATEIRMVAVSTMDPDLPPLLPGLALVQKLGAGVETIVNHPALPPHVRVTRLKPDAPAREIAEWFLAYVLRETRNMAFHAAEQSRSAWAPRAPREAHKTTVAVLGLGHIGSRTAGMFRDIGYQVVGWSRSPKALDGITCHHGPDGLSTALAEADFVCAILPSTRETRDMFDRARFATMKPGAVFLNAGRGDLVVEPDLISALDTGPLAHAVLDVVRTEPMPADNPLWQHPQVTITPHVSGWHLGDAMKDVAENFRRLTAGEALLHEVDRKRGY